MRKTALATLLLFTTSIAIAADTNPKPASPATVAANASAKAALPVDDGSDAQFAAQGFVGSLPDPIIRNAKGEPLWNLDQYAWVKGNAPNTVNPSLWRHMTLLNRHGLYKVADGVWQVRGFDVSNMTLIAGRTGWIVIDPLTRKEMAQAALGLANTLLGTRAVSAVIFTHSHSDHFGGVRGLFEQTETKRSRVPIMAPEHFIEEAASENVIAGTAMGRRAVYQFGGGLKPGPQGQMGSGIGMGLAGGNITLIAPTDLIRKTGETRKVDGVLLEFQMVPESEAPAELNVMLPAQKTLVIGEIAVCSQHNILTPRGALVRNTLRWAGFLTEAINLYSDRSDQVAASHCWPRFGKQNVRDFLAIQRDNYKFLHDQSVRLMNKGLNATELAEELKPPKSISDNWSTRGYYGTYNHNAKAVYQRYLGWYDANPANLNPHIPTERAKRYVAAMGGEDKVLDVARKAMTDGDYRWSSDLLNQLVFANPDNADARALLADSYEQQGYQSESSLWRNMFLSGAAELRGGVSGFDVAVSLDLAAAIPTNMLMDMIATRLDPAAIGDKTLKINLRFADKGEEATISVANQVMVSEMGKQHISPQASISGPRQLILGLLVAKIPIAAMEKAGLKIEGDRTAVEALYNGIEGQGGRFNIVTP